MRHAGIPATSLVVGALLFSACTSLPRTTVGLVEDSASACAEVVRGTATPGQQEFCNLYFDIVVLDKLRPYLEEALRPDLTVVLVPCLADGPHCRWQEDYDRRFRAGLKLVSGDPWPQPSAPIPFDAIPPQVQLERTVELRDALSQAVTELDEQVEALRAAQLEEGATSTEE